MSRVLIPSGGPESWRAFLAKPELHWAMGYSARTLAHCWEAADGLPPEITAILKPVLGPVEPLITIPEYKTKLPGGRRESQSDVFMLGRHSTGTVACAIEGKVDEPFGPTVAQQMAAPSMGQTERMNFLCRRLKLNDCPGKIHYQLLHRTVSALIEADRFCTTHAAMIVHSFSPTKKWFDAFGDFVTLLGGEEVKLGEPIVINGLGQPLIFGWAAGADRFRQC